MTQPRFLVDCPSPPHRAVAGALRLALTGDLAAGVEEDCDQTDPLVFAEIAQSHYIDTALSPAFDDTSPLRAHFPDDLALFFKEMAAANARRNARLREQLETIGAALVSHGIDVVALKGACELIDPWWQDPGGRYLSDLDLLVAEDDAMRAAQGLLELGARRANADDGPKNHHHLPPFLAPDWEAMVELHTQVGPPHMAAHLPANAVIAHARLSSLPCILSPLPKDRLLHLLLHAPKGGMGVRGGRLYLREIANIWAAQSRLGRAAIEDIEDQIAARGGGGTQLPFGALTDAILGSGERPLARAARSALTRFGRPDRESRQETLKWSVYYLWSALSDKTRRSDYLAKITRPGGWKALREFHKRRRNMTR